MRILIADDDPVSRLMLTALLRKWGYDPLVTTNGLEALLCFEKGDPPELAILDWMMPELEGPEVCRRIRERFPSLPIYIILLTAKAQREDLFAGLAAGADDYVTKPFDHKELHARFQVGLRVVDLQTKLAARIEELDVALTQLHLMQQAQKLEALGQMSSGIAHEINTPTQYIGQNIRFIQESWPQIQTIFEKAHTNPDIEYLLKEIPKAIGESLQGVEKVSTIVRAMRDFSRTTSEHKTSIDINRAIETTITVATARWRYVADLETDLDPDLPPAICFPGEIHQVLFNLILNAADTIEDAGRAHRGTIHIATSTSNGWIEIRISDTGTGIPEEYRARVFEPFFTTREVGRGTGHGLAAAYSIIVQQHAGEISFETETGSGTTFLIRIPVDGIGENRHDRKTSGSIR